jgi:cytochrome P450 family 142 subfamily A polypeptide 1
MTIDLMAGEFWADDPHAAFTWMRANAPVYFDGRVWALTTHDLVRQASRQPQIFCSSEGARPDVPAIPMMIDMDDPDHIKRRLLVSRGFTPRRVRESEAEVREVCDFIIDEVIERGECDFVYGLAAWLPLILIGNALGFPREKFPDLLRWSDDLLATASGEDRRPDSVAEAYMSFREFVVPAIEQRREHPTDDLLSILVHADVDGERLDVEELIHEALLILIGGDETTRHVISGGMYQLLVNPDQLADLRDDRNLLETAIEEMLRWVTPVKNFNRTTTEDVELEGVTIPKGSKVLLIYPSANRDEKVFDDPFRFDIRRTPNDHVAFGFGPHHCLGSSLARLELTCFFDRLLTRIPDLRLAEPGEPKNRAAAFVSGYEKMPVVFTPGPRIRA